ncbi:MaoC/PaaZ C-terminal domain-containing protein [Georgenia yuyongxinii]|nr:MaoC/PaaZ C-terminal domain-containing protein [Georgenia yuyongxinii]
MSGVAGASGGDGTDAVAQLPAGPPAGYREEVLAAMPSLGRLYARALGRSRALVLTSRPLARHALPRVVLRVDGVRADAARLSQYQHLVGEPGTDVLPGGYVHVVAFPLAMAVMVRPDFPLPAVGMVHVANRVEQHRAFHLEETLTVRAWAENARGHARGTQVDLVVVVSAGDEPVWRGISTYLARRRLPGPTAPEADRGVARQPVPTTATTLWRLGADAGKRYAEVSGDRNPIHVSRLGARLFGFPRPIAHGMYTAALALAGTSPVRGMPLDWTVDFARPVLLPATVGFATTRDGDVVRYAAWSARTGKPYLTGTVTARLTD